jgi:broad specificity phosphatase PhoE
LDFAPWIDKNPSDEICPFCGIQFGYNDARPDLREEIYREWRDAWIDNGRQPFNGEEWRRLSKRVAGGVDKKRGGS